MRAGAARGALVIAFAAGAWPMAGCTLDFDRYDPADADAMATEGDGGTAMEGAALSLDAGAPQDATIDSVPEASASEASRDAAGCAASPGCLTTAGTCGVACGQIYLACLQDCDPQTCTDVCRSGEQSCLGKCVSSCIACTSDAGCATSGASTMCINDSHP